MVHFADSPALKQTGYLQKRKEDKETVNFHGAESKQQAVAKLI